MRNILAGIVLVLASCAEQSDVPKSSGPPPAAPKDAPVKSSTISKGKKYSPKDYLVAGYVTILDFYADW